MGIASVIPMSNFLYAIDLICKHEGFNEKAYANPITGQEPYTFGYGTQFYPDGLPVMNSKLIIQMNNPAIFI